MTGWKLANSNGLQYIWLKNWDTSGVTAAFSCRSGGISRGSHGELNLALHVGDEPQRVLANRSRLMEALGSATEQMVCCEQVHGTEVALIENDMAGRGALDDRTAIPGCDGMITATPGLYLAAFFADCLPLFFYDRARRVIGLAHAGWKGTMGRIGQQTVARMQQVFASHLKDIEVFIGPGIGTCCFEIQPDLAERVKIEFPGHAALLKQIEGRLYWDLAQTNLLVLQEAGICAHNIEISGLCTFCHADRFFSHRRDRGHTGRMGAFIGLRW